MKYLTLKEISESEDYPFGLTTLYKMVGKATENGLSMALRKVGKKLLINKDKFEEWIEQHESTDEHRP